MQFLTFGLVEVGMVFFVDLLCSFYFIMSLKRVYATVHGWNFGNSIGVPNVRGGPPLEGPPSVLGGPPSGGAPLEGPPNHNKGLRPGASMRLKLFR